MLISLLSPFRSSSLPTDISDLLDPNDERLQKACNFTAAVKAAKKRLSGVSNPQRDDAIVKVVQRWTPTDERVSYAELDRLDYLLYSLKPAENGRRELTPLVEDLYLAYLRQGAFGPNPHHPILSELLGFLSEEFKASPRCYSAAREGLCSLLTTGAYHESIFGYLGFAQYRGALQQDREVQLAACEFFNLKARQGDLRYEFAHKQARLFGVTRHFLSDGFVEAVKLGIGEFVTANLSAEASGAQRATKELSLPARTAGTTFGLMQLNEMACFLPWGDFRNGSIPAGTLEFIEQIKSGVRSLTLAVIREDRFSCVNGNTAADVALTAAIFLDRNFFKDPELLDAIANTTCNRLGKLRKSICRSKESVKEACQLLGLIPPEEQKILLGRENLQGAANQVITQLLIEANRLADRSYSYFSSDAQREGEDFASGYTYSIITLPRIFGIKQVAVPEPQGARQPHYKRKLASLLEESDLLLAKDQAAFAETLKKAGPDDEVLLTHLDQISARDRVHHPHTPNYAFTHLAEKLRFLRHLKPLPDYVPREERDSAGATAAAALIYRSYRFWEGLGGMVDRRLLNQLADMLDARVAKSA